ncbi:c-type cytochrome [Geomonas sp. RF6]|uniref:c-type cytochrome n=1 Tax=Geomonas sp. RF6 TaxID=2897342 RepID=UPI001E556CFA|nr:c-type cytochrome [Geomonas sp. RF6]UFS69963.1 c-type cytochrome [Geomonas sp. RF6]
MKKGTIATVAMLSISLFATSAFCDTKKGEKVDGKAEFEKHCAACHPNGGNVSNPQKTLSKAVMAKNGVKSQKDIIAKMRNPGPGMTKFDAKTVPDKEAKAIADYILKTFK